MLYMNDTDEQVKSHDTDEQAPTMLFCNINRVRQMQHHMQIDTPISRVNVLVHDIDRIYFGDLHQQISSAGIIWKGVIRTRNERLDIFPTTHERDLIDAVNARLKLLPSKDPLSSWKVW